MNFKEFKVQLENLAKIPEDNLKSIQALVSKYYRRIDNLEFYCSNRYVVRSSKNDKGDVFTNIDRCSYNPNFEKIPLQRCNYPKQPFFYCSMYTETNKGSTSLTCIMETALAEIKNYRIKKSYYTLSRWDLVRPLKLWVLPFSKLSHKQNKDFKHMSDNLKKTLKTHPQKTDIIKSFKYMSEVFCKRNNKMVYYKISSAFFNYLLHSQKISGSYCDGLAYPSANTERAGMNIVLKRELIDNRILYCTSGTMYSMTRNPENKKGLGIFPCSETSFPDSKGDFFFNIYKDAQSDFI